MTLQDGPEVRDYVAHVASPEEKADSRPKATAVWPAYDDYQASTDRDIPVVVLEPQLRRRPRRRPRSASARGAVGRHGQAQRRRRPGRGSGSPVPCTRATNAAISAA